MPRFLPRSARKRQDYPACVDLHELFSGEKFKPSLERVAKFLSGIYASHSDGSCERTGRPGVITEQFLVNMPTIDALISEIELMNGIHDHASGEIDDEKVKVYLKKYLDTHTFVYKEVEPDKWTCEIKSGYSKRTGREIPLFYTDRVVNPIQLKLMSLIDQNHAEYAVTRL